MSKPYSEKEKLLIAEHYKKNKDKKGGWLAELSIAINRPKENICRYARQNNLSNKKRGIAIIKIKCEQCGKEIKKKPYNKKITCDKKCGDILGSIKRTGGHIWATKKHPKGMLGKKHSDIFIKNQSLRMIENWNDKNHPFNSENDRQRRSDSMMLTRAKMFKENSENTYSRTIKGWREIGGQRHFFRSKWEMNIAYYLEWLKLKKQIQCWDYECETFWFEKIKRGVRSYTPDFKVTELNGKTYFIEVKGWMDSKSKTKLARIKKYYPNIKVDLYDEQMYKALKKQVGNVCGWE